jgi:hypothetical protein
MTGDEISPYKDFSQKQNGRFLARECPLYSTAGFDWEIRVVFTPRSVEF